VAKPIVYLDTPYPTLDEMALRAGMTAKELSELKARVRVGVPSRRNSRVRAGKSPKRVRQN
jgi:hypothetical protein